MNGHCRLLKVSTICWHSLHAQKHPRLFLNGLIELVAAFFICDSCASYLSPKVIAWRTILSLRSSQCLIAAAIFYSSRHIDRISDEITLSGDWWRTGWVHKQLTIFDDYMAITRRLSKQLESSHRVQTSANDCKSRNSVSKFWKIDPALYLQFQTQ